MDVCHHADSGNQDDGGDMIGNRSMGASPAGQKKNTT